MANRKLTKTFTAEFGVAGKAKGSRPVTIKAPRRAGDENKDMAPIASLLLDGQLEIVATIMADGDCDGQAMMSHADPKVKPLECVATCSSTVKFSTTHVSFRLNLPLDVKPAHLDKFAFASGRIKLTRIGDRPTGEAEEASTEEEPAE